MNPPQNPAKIAKWIMLAAGSLCAVLGGFAIVISGAVAAYAVGYSQVQGAFCGIAFLLLWNLGFALAKAAVSFDPKEIDDKLNDKDGA